MITQDQNDLICAKITDLLRVLQIEIQNATFYKKLPNFNPVLKSADEIKEYLNKITVKEQS